MTYDECLKITINDSVADVLKRLPHLSPDDRYALMMDHFENIASEIDMDDVLMVPNFKEKEE